MVTTIVIIAIERQFHVLITNMEARNRFTPIFSLNNFPTNENTYPIADKIAIVNNIILFFFYIRKKFIKVAIYS